MAAAVRDRDDVFPTHPEPVRNKKKPPREPQVYLDIHHFSSGVGSRARRARCAWTSFFFVAGGGNRRDGARCGEEGVGGGGGWVGVGWGGARVWWGREKKTTAGMLRALEWPRYICILYIILYYIYIVVVNIHNHKRKEKVGIELRGLLAVHHHHLSKPIGQA